MPVTSSPVPHPLAAVIEVDSSRCVNCHACIGVCPVKHCNDGSGTSVIVDHDTCIGCGRCIEVCRHKARRPRDDAERFFADLLSGVPMVVLVAPAVAAVFPAQWLHFNGWLAHLGVKAVFDVSFGAELTVKSYLDHIERNHPATVIAQPCPALVTWVELYKPELIPYLAPADSPMLHTARMIRRFHPEFASHRIAVMSPCIAKRREFDDTGICDYNVTFNSVLAWLQTRGKRITDYPELEYNNPPAERAVMFSSPGGLLETATRWTADLAGKTRRIEGPHTVYRYLDRLPDAIRDGDSPFLIDCLNCELGCNGGPGTGNYHTSQDKMEAAVARRAKAMSARYAAADGQASGAAEVHAAVLAQLNRYWEPGLYARSYVDRSANVRWRQPTPAQVQEIYHLLEKRDEQDVLDCGSCGYGSCHEMAVALHNHLSHADNCRLYKQRRSERAVQDGARGVEQLGAHARFLSTAVQEVRAAVADVERGAQGASATAEAGRETAQRAGAAVRVLAEAGAAIADFSTTVQRIATQTRLLALNAHIEAARVGNVGAGFKVVAHEVKDLARASGEAAVEIARRVEEIEKGCEAAIQLVDELARVTEEIRTSQGGIAAAVSQQAGVLREMGEQVVGVVAEADERAQRLAQLLDIEASSPR